MGHEAAQVETATANGELPFRVYERRGLWLWGMLLPILWAICFYLWIVESNDPLRASIVADLWFALIVPVLVLPGLALRYGTYSVWVHPDGKLTVKPHWFASATELSLEEVDVLFRYHQGEFTSIARRGSPDRENADEQVVEIELRQQNKRLVRVKCTTTNFRKFATWLIRSRPEL